MKHLVKISAISALLLTITGCTSGIGAKILGSDWRVEASLSRGALSATQPPLLNKTKTPGF